MIEIILSFVIYDLSRGERVALDTFLKRIEDARVIYLGEIHNSRHIHAFQLEVIKYLQSKGKKLAIAFEMFQKPFQKYLDEFVEGRISEVEMLYRTQWHKRWKMDIGLYRDIWNFARKKKIKLLAINVPTEFRRKARSMDYKQIMDSEYVSKDAQLPDETYRKHFLELIGEDIERHGNIGLEKMIKGMWLWDEAMAKSISDFMKEHPEHTVVVIVGYGHVYGREGIPKRVERMTGVRGVVVIPLTNISKDMNKGDFAIVPRW